MNNSQLPFADLEIFLNFHINVELKAFYKSYENEFYGSRVKKIDRNIHTVTFLKDSYQGDELEYVIIKFEDILADKLSFHIHNSLQNLTILYQDNFENSEKIKGFVKFHLFKIDNIFTSELLENFPFLNTYLHKIKNHIKDYTKSDLSVGNTKPLSLSIRLNEGEDETDKIKKLFNLLILDQPLIQCTFEDFALAFSNKQTINGINWLVKNPKNKDQTSKPSLIHFLRLLANSNIIEKSYYSSENLLILNVFRNFDGSSFTSNQISTSKSNMSPLSNTQEERFNQIISNF